MVLWYLPWEMAMQIFMMARMERFMLVVMGTGCNFSNDFTRETDPYVDFQHCVLCALQKEMDSRRCGPPGKVHMSEA